ncbi:MAG: PA0069 family radical SAM protein [Pseudomonadales bacterium]
MSKKRPNDQLLSPREGPGVSQGPGPLKGLGAQSNRPSRYLQHVSEVVDDGWSTDPAAKQPPVRVQLLPDRSKTLLTVNQSPDIPFDRSINPYKGCEHGCIYCFARPTHAWLDLSPGLDFERKIFYKTNVEAHLRTLFARPNYQCAPIAMGTNTDPYQPVEKQQQVTRRILQTLLAHRHPVTIVTKGQGVLRDLDLLTALAELNLVKVMVSVTTLSLALKTRLEPRTASPNKRLAIMAALAEARVPVGAMIAPVIPFINDAELEAMVTACYERGARELNYILLRLPLEVAPLFEEWLDAHYPLKAARVMSVIHQSRGGKAYDARWGLRMRGEGPFADLLAARFARALRSHGLAGAKVPPLRTDLFRSHTQDPRPARRSNREPQQDLFSD